MEGQTREKARQGVTEADVTQLRRLCEEIRYDIVDTLGEVGSGHPGPSLSIVEILTTLYFHEIRVNPSDPKDPTRDRLILSKGHGAVGLYATLARAGFFPREELYTFESLGSRLQGHPDARLTPGVEVSTGSLGQGLSFAVGTALGARMRGQEFRSYCILGDGETQEGNVWEAMMSASKFCLDNLVAIVDWNGLQGGVTLEVMPSMEPYAAKWSAFGWNAVEADGNDVGSLLDAYGEARANSGRPTVIIARTTKGKGVSYMEGRPEWHSGKVAGEQLEQAKREIRSRIEALE